MLYKPFIAESAVQSNFDGVPAESDSTALRKIVMVSSNLATASVTHKATCLAEICYRMQYPVRNHRHRGDPFSMRQIGVCERSNGPQDCAWIVLQPSQEILSLLEAKISSADYFSTHAKDPISLHLVFHDFQTSKWDDYVEHLRTTLEALVRCAPHGMIRS